MFEQPYEFTGKHAEYVGLLVDNGIFKRNIDVYMLGATFGLLYNCKSEIDPSLDKIKKIAVEQLVREKSKCEFLFRLVMLLDKTNGVTEEDRINRTFRQDADEVAVAKNMELFNSYVLGGVEKLYEKFYKNCTTKDDYVDRAYKVISAFNADIEKSISDEELKDVLLSS